MIGFGLDLITVPPFRVFFSLRHVPEKTEGIRWRGGLLKGFSISVRTFAGKVTLIGAVDDSEQKKQGEARAGSVHGVVGVNNLLETKGR